MEINEYNCAVKHFLNNDVSIYNISKSFNPIILKKRRNYFKNLCLSIIGQQLSVNSARAIKVKFLNYFNNKPTPEKINEIEFNILRSLGLSNAKTKYVKDLSNKLLTGEVSLKNIRTRANSEIISELTKVKGIGIWTVHMFLIFVLGRKNILPFGDLGIKKAIMLNYALNKLPSEQQVMNISEKNNWSPYNSYASMLLWNSIDEG